MYIYPIGCCADKNNALGFSGGKNRNMGKKIKAVGDNFIKKCRSANDREEIYLVAKSYMKEGILPILDKNKTKDGILCRHQIVDLYAADIELFFDPSVVQAQDSLKNISLNGQKKHFVSMVDAINKISKAKKRGNINKN